jgi:hypothetical protein
MVMGMRGKFLLSRRYDGFRGRAGGAEEASRARVRNAWAKFRELSPLLTARGASLKVKGKLYSLYVQCVMMYGSETWAMKVEDMQRLERAEKMTIRWMDVWSDVEGWKNE